MDRASIEKLRDEFAKKADTAWRNYQETGLGRYETARIRNEDLQEALTAALDAKENTDLARSLKAEMVDLAYRAERALHSDGSAESVLKSLVSYASLVCGYRRRWEP